MVHQHTQRPNTHAHKIIKCKILNLVLTVKCNKNANVRIKLNNLIACSVSCVIGSYEMYPTLKSKNSLPSDFLWSRGKVCITSINQEARNCLNKHHHGPAEWQMAFSKAPDGFIFLEILSLICSESCAVTQANRGNKCLMYDRWATFVRNALILNYTHFSQIWSQGFVSTFQWLIKLLWKL